MKNEIGETKKNAESVEEKNVTEKRESAQKKNKKDRAMRIVNSVTQRK